MKLTSTISLPKEVKSFAFSSAFKSRAERREFIRLMVELEYQKDRMSRMRGRREPEAAAPAVE